MIIDDALGKLDPEQMVIADKLLIDADLKREDELDRLNRFYQDTTKLDLPERIVLMTILNSSNGIYAAKLNFAERCQILALHRMGESAMTLSKLYGVNRRTIVSIYNPYSPHYKSVRKEEVGLTRDGFRKTYLTEDVIQRLTDFKLTKGVAKNNPAANKMAGTHTMLGRYCEYVHRVEIGWMDDGWYFRDLDGDHPDKWLRGSFADATKTSNACYRSALYDLSDKLS